MSTKAVKKTAVSTKKVPATTAAKDKKVKKTESKQADSAVAQTQVSLEKKERKRRQVDKESVDTAFSDIQNRISAEIEKLREADGKVRGIKFLRSIGKAIKTLHSDTKRVMKLKKKNNRKKTVASGFLRPVKISAELAAFTGWDINQTYSRVTVTKFICDYIKNNKLYDEGDKRNIQCDEKLKALLKYDPNNVPIGKDGKPQVLNYFRLQRFLKTHFLKVEMDKTVEATKPASEQPAKKTKPAVVAKAASEQPAKKVAAPAAAPAKVAQKKVEVEDEDLEDDEL